MVYVRGNGRSLPNGLALRLVIYVTGMDGIGDISIPLFQSIIYIANNLALLQMMSNGINLLN